MVLISQSEYESLKTNKGNTSSVRQLTNIDVGKGGKVTVRNDDNIKNYANPTDSNRNYSQNNYNPNNAIPPQLRENERPEYADAAEKNVISDEDGNIKYNTSSNVNNNVSTQNITSDSTNTIENNTNAKNVLSDENAKNEIDLSDENDMSNENELNEQPILEEVITKVLDKAKEMDTPIIEITTDDLENTLETSKNVEEAIDTIDSSDSNETMNDTLLENKLENVLNKAKEDNSDIVKIEVDDLERTLKNSVNSRHTSQVKKGRKLGTVIDRLNEKINTSKSKRDEYVKNKRSLGKIQKLVEEIKQKKDDAIKRKRDDEEDDIELPEAKRVDNRLRSEDVVHPIMDDVIKTIPGITTNKLDEHVRDETIPGIARDIISKAYTSSEGNKLVKPLTEEIINDFENPILENTVSNILEQANETGANVVQIKTSDLEQSVKTNRKKRVKLENAISKLREQVLKSEKKRLRDDDLDLIDSKRTDRHEQNDENIMPTIMSDIVTRAEERGEDKNIVKPIVAEVLSEAQNPILENTLSGIVDEAKDNKADVIEVKTSDLEKTLKQSQLEKNKLHQAVKDSERKKETGKRKITTEKSDDDDDDDAGEISEDGMAAKKSRQNAKNRGLNITPNLKELLTNVDNRANAREVVKPIISNLISNINYSPQNIEEPIEPSNNTLFKRKIDREELASLPKSISSYITPRRIDIFKESPQVNVEMTDSSSSSPPPSPSHSPSITKLSTDYPAVTAADVTNANIEPYIPVQQSENTYPGKYASVKLKPRSALPSDENMDLDMDMIYNRTKYKPVEKEDAKTLTKNNKLQHDNRSRARDEQFNKNRSMSNESKKLIVSYPKESEIMKNITIRNPPQFRSERNIEDIPITKYASMKKKSKEERAQDKLISVERARAKRKKPTKATELKNRIAAARDKKNMTEPTIVRRSTRIKKPKVYDDYEMWD